MYTHVWKKKSKTFIKCKAKSYPPRRFTGLPDSPIKFDPDRLAQFFNEEVSKLPKNEGGLTYKICKLYANDTPFNDIVCLTGIHRQQAKREIQKGLKWFLKNYKPPETPPKRGKIVDPDFWASFPKITRFS